MNKYEISQISVLVLIGILIFLATNVSASTMIRTPSANVVAPGQTFTVTYTTQNVPNSKYFVAWEDSISGGCSPSSYKQFIASESGGVEQITKTFTAPQSGSCTFSGYYQYADATQTNFQDFSINVSVPCSSGSNQTCSAQNTCNGIQFCTDGQWGPCTTTLTLCVDNSCQISCSSSTGGNTNTGTNQSSGNGDSTGGANSFSDFVCPVLEPVAIYQFSSLTKCQSGGAIFLIIFLLILFLK